jgi:ATP-dependent Zn protease
MVTQYGMSAKFGMMGLESPQNQYLVVNETIAGVQFMEQLNAS